MLAVAARQELTIRRSTLPQRLLLLSESACRKCRVSADPLQGPPLFTCGAPYPSRSRRVLKVTLYGPIYAAGRQAGSGPQRVVTRGLLSGFKADLVHNIVAYHSSNQEVGRVMPCVHLRIPHTGRRKRGGVPHNHHSRFDD